MYLVVLINLVDASAIQGLYSSTKRIAVIDHNNSCPGSGHKYLTWIQQEVAYISGRKRDI